MALVAFRLKNSAILEPRVAIGGAEATPRRVAQAEAALDGHPANVATFAATADAAARAIDPLDDENTSADYRRGLVRTVVLRALEQAVA